MTAMTAMTMQEQQSNTVWAPSHHISSLDHPQMIVSSSNTNVNRKLMEVKQLQKLGQGKLSSQAKTQEVLPNFRSVDSVENNKKQMQNLQKTNPFLNMYLDEAEINESIRYSGLSKGTGNYKTVAQQPQNAKSKRMNYNRAVSDELPKEISVKELIQTKTE